MVVVLEFRSLLNLPANQNYNSGIVADAGQAYLRTAAEAAVSPACVASASIRRV